MEYEFHFIIAGEVQGVGFRFLAKHYANRLGLVGYVRNLQDGNVEICVAGTEKDAEKLLEIMKKESLPIQISSISSTKKPLQKTYTSFDILI
jgi:acylphosphatase